MSQLIRTEAFQGERVESFAFNPREVVKIDSPSLESSAFSGPRETCVLHFKDGTRARVFLSFSEATRLINERCCEGSDYMTKEAR